MIRSGDYGASQVYSLCQLSLQKLFILLWIRLFNVKLLSEIHAKKREDLQFMTMYMHYFSFLL